MGCFRGGLSAESLAGDGDQRLRVRATLVVDQRGLWNIVAVLACPVCPLGADVMLDAYFMSDKVHADPVFKVNPFPFENHLPDRRVLAEQHTSLPGRAGFLLPLFLMDGRAGRIRDIAPDRACFRVLDFELFVHEI